MYRSILFYNSSSKDNNTNDKNKRFHKDMYKDLNLEQMFSNIALGSYNKFVLDILHTPLQDFQDISYRQQIFSDLEDEEVYSAIRSFTRCIDHVDSQFNSLDRLVYEEQKESCFLHIIEEYCRGINQLANTLRIKKVNSTGLKAIIQVLNEYTRSEQFTSMDRESKQLIKDAKEVRYNLSFEEYSIKINKPYEGVDLNTELEEVFGNFLKDKQRKGHCRHLQNDINMNSVEYSVLSCVKRMNPKIFQDIREFMHKYQTYKDPSIEMFRKEIQFYMTYMNYIEPMKAAYLPFCFPEVAETMEQCSIVSGYDVELGNKVIKEKKSIVLNDFECRTNERVFIVTGPNQGGKTTYSRMLGQIHYLFLLGVPVPAYYARLMICKGIFTHYEKEEVAYNDNGKLQDDLVRMHDIMNNLSEHCLVVMNEMLSSTSYQDAVEIGEKIIHKLEEYDSISIFVTFVDELAKMSGKVVSLASLVDDTENGTRTFKIERKRTDGNVYAKSLADKYNLSYRKITERLAERAN